MKKLALLLFMSVFFSCTNNETQSLDSENVASKNGRMYFKNWEDFSKKYHDYSQENLNTPQSDFSENEFSADLTPAFNKILNKNMEFQITDNIIWYRNGVFYSINIKKQNEIDALKIDFSNLEVCDKITISPVKNLNLEKSNNNNRTLIGANGSLDSRYQLEFNRTNYYDCVSGIDQGPVSAKLKYIHELYTVKIYGGPAPVYFYYLYLKLKLEWRNSPRDRWRYAAEKRNITVNITDDSKITNTAGGIISSNIYTPAVGPYSISTSFQCSNDQTILLRNANYHLSVPNWSADVRGTITHGINGDNPSNIYYNTVAW